MYKWLVLLRRRVEDPEDEKNASAFFDADMFEDPEDEKNASAFFEGQLRLLSRFPKS